MIASGGARTIRRLYISDLDGTLLNSQAEVTDRTAEIINALTEQGMEFSVATARSIYSVKPITAKLGINAPCLLMNGVSMYDLRADRYIYSESIPTDAQRRIIDIFHESGVSCFMYKVREGLLAAYYEKITTHVMNSFAEARKNKYNKPFVQCGNMHDEADCGTIYFTAVDEREILLPVKEAVAGIEGADFTFYEDTYTHKWYLEIFSDRASKANGLKRLRSDFGYDEIICFGDNLNDLSMFAEADLKIAVENARPEVKAAADTVIGSNDEDGVAEWLMKNVKAIPH